MTLELSNFGGQFPLLIEQVVEFLINDFFERLIHFVQVVLYFGKTRQNVVETKIYNHKMLINLNKMDKMDRPFPRCPR